jgi:hypothetical protein
MKTKESTRAGKRSAQKAVAKTPSAKASTTSRLRKAAEKVRSPAVQLDGFIAKFTPEMAAQIRVALEKMGRLLPGAFQLVYDNYNFFVVGFGPTERPSEALFSIVADAHGVRLCFLKGAGLPDPEKLLRGSGNLVRNVFLEGPATLDQRAVMALMRAAMAKSPKKFDSKQTGQLIIRSVSAKQRPRRVEKK